MLEKQQQEILAKQQVAGNRHFFLVSLIIGLVACFVVYMAGKYIMFPDAGDGYAMPGKFVMYGGMAVVAALVLVFNWRHRNTGKSNPG